MAESKVAFSFIRMLLLDLFVTMRLINSGSHLCFSCHFLSGGNSVPVLLIKIIEALEFGMGYFMLIGVI